MSTDMVVRKACEICRDFWEKTENSGEHAADDCEAMAVHPRPQVPHGNK